MHLGEQQSALEGSEGGECERGGVGGLAYPRRRWQVEIETTLLASGLAYTLLRSNVQMQNLLALGPAIAKTGGFGSSQGNGRVGLIDARDVGEVAAVIAASPTPHAEKTYWLTGPEVLTYANVAATLSKVLGRETTYRELSFEEEKNAMIGAGVPEPIADMNALVFKLNAEGFSDWATEDVPTLLGRPARSFEQLPPTTPPRSRRHPHTGHPTGVDNFSTRREERTNHFH